MNAQLPLALPAVRAGRSAPARPASPHDRLLCVDIETVPDREIMPPDWGDKFPKPAWHRVVAVSLVEAVIHHDAGGERYEVTCCRSGGEAGWDEPRLLRAWWAFFARRPTRLVTWNGRGFDCLVLKLRAMMHGISAGNWYTSGTRHDGYTARYSADWHCDLMEVLADHGAGTRMGLDDVAHAIGLPGKVGGHGSEVAGMVERGELERVRGYCEGDVLNLFALYVRWAHLAGKTGPEGHDASIASLVGCLERERAVRPHLGEFLDRWRASGRPCPMFVANARSGGPRSMAGPS